MAAEDALNAKPYSLQHTPFIDGINHVLAAGWFKAAMRTEQWRQCPLIEANREDENFLEHNQKV
jgi:hypothetical protein